jgi:hypothetical protein
MMRALTHFFRVSLVFLFLVLVSGGISAREVATDANDRRHLIDEEIAMSKLRVERAQLDQEETKAIYEYKKAERHAAIQVYDLRRKLSERQLYYHPIVLTIVILIVLSGVAFCAFQVWRDIRLGATTVNTFKISREGLELSSSVIGLVSLGLSFLFFYCYVTAIYRLSDADETISPRQGSSERSSQSAVQK